MLNTIARFIKKTFGMEVFFLPLILLLLFVNYKMYRFYIVDFKYNYAYVNPDFKKVEYDRVQREHPYYDLYLLSKTVKDPANNILYLRNKHVTKKDATLSELNIMIDYFFYPYVIKPHSWKGITKITLKNGQYIISDFILPQYSVEANNLVYQPLYKKQLIRVNRWDEEGYAIYLVQKPK